MSIIDKLLFLLIRAYLSNLSKYTDDLNTVDTFRDLLLIVSELVYYRVKIIFACQHLTVVVPQKSIHCMAFNMV